MKYKKFFVLNGWDHHGRRIKFYNVAYYDDSFKSDNSFDENLFCLKRYIKNIFGNMLLIHEIQYVDDGKSLYKTWFDFEDGYLKEMMLYNKNANVNEITYYRNGSVRCQIIFNKDSKKSKKYIFKEYE